MSYKPRRVEAPRLDVSAESMKTFKLLDKIKKYNYQIPPPFTLADVEWVSTSVWYKPWTWGQGFIRVKLKAILEVENDKRRTNTDNHQRYQR